MRVGLVDRFNKDNYTAIIDQVTLTPTGLVLLPKDT